MQYKPVPGARYQFQIIDDQSRACADFRLIDVPAENPVYCKQMSTELSIHQEVSDEIIIQNNLALLFDIFYTVFHAVLEITHSDKGLSMCKLYASEAPLAMIYRKFADNLDKQGYSIKTMVSG